ncbi:MAG: hypothetical protein ACR2NP_22720 [Pirellulaceae bacterium]
MNSELQQAMELMQSGQWEAAHEIVQTRNDELACWMHAWLHRQEGDIGNATYWYRRAGRLLPDSSLEEELELIGQSLS